MRAERYERTRARRIDLMGQTPSVPAAMMEIIGVHPVDGVDCFLIEAVIAGVTTQPDFGQVTQPSERLAQPDWQVAYNEVLLDADGASVVADLLQTTVSDWPAQARVAFFLHHLDIERPIRTPFGDVIAPQPTARPDRLTMIEYEAP